MLDAQKIAVFVPANPTATLIARGSAIVGQTGGEEGEHITIYYEGNLLGYADVKTYADRAMIAADRLAARYPTIARATVPQSALRQIGWFNPETGIELFDEVQTKDALAFWLAVEVIEEKELHFSA